MSADAMYRHRYGGPPATRPARHQDLAGRVVEEMFGAEPGEPTIERLVEVAESYMAAVGRSGFEAYYLGQALEADYHGKLSPADEVSVFVSGVRADDAQRLWVTARHLAEGPISVRVIQTPRLGEGSSGRTGADYLVVFGTHFSRG